MSHRIGRLHVITDTQLQQQWTHAELAREASAGGADVVQFRHKTPASTDELLELAQEVRGQLASGTRLIVNDHVAVAQSIAGAGVHLGRHDMTPTEARRLLGDTVVIGATANSLEEARTRFDAPVDYLGIGPVFGTQSKAQPAPRLGLEALAAIVQESPVPVIAIGGIEPQHVASILACGAHGIAVLSGAVCQADVQAAVSRYRQAIDAIPGHDTAGPAPQPPRAEVR